MTEIERLFYMIALFNTTIGVTNMEGRKEEDHKITSMLLEIINKQDQILQKLGENIDVK